MPDPVKVSVLTASVPERSRMLGEAKESVLGQVCPGVEVEHLYSVDVDREGAGALLNRMLLLASGDWVMVLDDDDLLRSNHIATVTAGPLDDVDVVYSLPIPEGDDFTQYDVPFDPARLAIRNIVSHTALMRADKVREVGGWSNIRAFDWDLFRRLEQAGADFHQIPERTWIYRLHGANWSHGTLPEAAPL